ncbi:unnamed protein product [Rotaria sp. Silwood2]|nr:unnamed protein product [Rotaria sp. Silwood2]
MNRYLTILILLFGSFGNVLNLIIFYQPKHRTNPCAVYFFYTSIAGLIALYSGLLSRVFAGFSLDISATNATLCKSRAFIIWVSTTASSWFLTYATIDRYCISCRDVHRRNLSNLRFTRRLMLMTIVGGSLVFAETFYCYVPNLQNSPLTCYGYNMICRLYNEIASALVFVFIPSTIMFIFGYGTVQNVRKLNHVIAPTAITHGTIVTMKKTDRQLIQINHFFMDNLLNEAFHFDVDTYATLIDNRVQIECAGERNYSGRVYTVDPLTQSIVLIDDTSNRVHIVLRPDIIQLKILDRNISHQANKDPFLPSNSTTDNQDESIGDRLGKIRRFLSSKRIPFQEKFEENNSITILIQNGIVQINAPYTYENILGTNEIVLSRIKLLLKQIIN